jgi:hypothetical protein
VVVSTSRSEVDLSGQLAAITTASGGRLKIAPNVSPIAGSGTVSVAGSVAPVGIRRPGAI